MSLENLKNFCPLPFISLFTFNSGAIKICCDSEAIGNLQNMNLKEAWNGDAIKEVRRAFLADQRHSVCRKCWNKEEAGLQSARQTHEFNLSHMRDVSEDGFVTSFPRNLSVRLGNICNFKCVMCESGNSTKWIEDAEIFQRYVGTPKTDQVIPAVDIFAIDEWMDAAEEGPRLVYFVGGEPLLSKDFQKAIKYLATKKYSKSIVVRIFTNLSVDPSWLFPYAEAFERLELIASVDGTREHYNYIRFPGTWAHFDSQVQRVIDLAPQNVVFDFFFVLMSINVFNLSEFCSWVSSKDWKHLNPRIYTDILTEPDFLNIKHLPPAVQDRATRELTALEGSIEGQRLIKDELQNIKKYLENKFNVYESILQIEKLEKYLLALDAKRKTKSEILLRAIQKNEPPAPHL
jgi:sulfatase maturation enzyme AslB (radical SAM superfamily)